MHEGMLLSLILNYNRSAFFPLKNTFYMKLYSILRTPHQQSAHTLEFSRHYSFASRAWNMLPVNTQVWSQYVCLWQLVLHMLPSQTVGFLIWVLAGADSQIPLACSLFQVASTSLLPHLSGSWTCSLQVFTHRHRRDNALMLSSCKQHLARTQNSLQRSSEGSDNPTAQQPAQLPAPTWLPLSIHFSPAPSWLLPPNPPWFPYSLGLVSVT